MRFLGRIIKSLLWSLFSIIVFLLLVGLAKTHRDVSAYITFLNTTDWSVMHWSRPADRHAPFWSDTQISGDIADIIDEDLDSSLTGLDVYDPVFEDDFVDMTGSSFSGMIEGDYGFTTGEVISSDDTSISGSGSQSELLNLIKQRELKK